MITRTARFSRFRLSAAIVLCSIATTIASAQTVAPRLKYSDLQSGPNTGGQDNKGLFVTIWGSNFGSSRNSSTVSVGGGAVGNYPVWTDTKITVQLGSNAQSGSIVVTTPGGASNGIPFTVRPGNVFFVAPGGNDSANGSYTAPFATIRNCKGVMQAGDTCYVRNGVSVSGTEDYNASVVIMSDIGGSGQSGRPKGLVVYPGESVTLGTITGPNSGIRFSSFHGTVAHWVLSGFNLRGNDGGALIEGIDDLRFVGNNCQSPNGNTSAACVETSQATNIKFFGNEVTNSGAANATKLYHAVYFSTDSNHIEAGWNWIHDNRGCRGIQFHSSPLDSSSGYNQYDLSVHDNLIHNIRCDGINFATVDPSKGKVEAYNNVIFNAGIGPDPPEGSASSSCILVAGFTNTGQAGSGTINLYNNTLYNCGTGGSDDSAKGAISSTVNPGLTTTLTNNLIYQPAGLRYIASDTVLGQMNGTNNLYFGNGPGPGVTTNNVNADPLFRNLSNKDFHLQSGSPAIGKGSSLLGLLLDIDGLPRPSGNVSIGAYEGGSGTTPGPNKCDLNGDNAVDTKDVSVSLNQALKLLPCTNGDLTGDGKCSVVDVQRIVNASLGNACRTGT